MKGMKHFFSLFYLLIMCALSAYAQTSQKVKVLEYQGEKGKKPLAQVEVVVGNAASATSDADGSCTLQFRTLKPGDKVLVRRVVRPGYVVFNQDALDHWRVKGEDEDDELVVVMCKQSLVMELRDKYQQAIHSSIDKDFETRKEALDKQLKAGKISQSNYEAKTKDLFYEHAEKLEEFDDVIEKFVYIDIEEITENEKRALDLISQGDVLGAIEVYDQEDSMSDYQEGHKTLAELNDDAQVVKQKLAESVASLDKTYEQVKRHVSLLRFQGGEENVARSVKLLHDVAYADTTNYTVLLDYAAYCNKIDNYQEAEAALRFCANAPDTIVRIQADIVQSNIHSRRSEYSKSVQLLERSVSYLRRLSAERNAPTLYLGMRAQATQGLVSAYTSLRDSVNWNKYRQIAVNLAYRFYQQKEDNASKRLLVETLYYANYGYTYFGKEYDIQLDAFLEATRLQQELYEADPTAQAAMLAYMHNALAGAYSRIAAKNKTDYGRMFEEYNKSIALYEEAYKKNPKAYVGYLGGEYRSLAHASIDHPDQLDKVLPLLRQAERYISEEARMSPETTRTRFANLYYTYMLYFNKKKDYEQCVSYATKAIDEILPLYEVSPKSSISTLRTTYRTLISALEKDPKNAAKVEMYKKQAEEKGVKL